MPSIKDQLETYSQQGYLVIPNALEAVDVDAINAAIDEDIVEPNPFWIEREEGHVALNVHMLLAYEVMDVSMRPPSLMPLLEGILGHDICAEEHSVRIRKPFKGEPYCNWHRDGGGWTGMPAGPPYYTHYVSVAFYLTDVDETTHTFSVLPGSGQSDDLPSLRTTIYTTRTISKVIRGLRLFLTQGCFTRVMCVRPTENGEPFTSTAGGQVHRPLAITRFFRAGYGREKTRRRSAITRVPTRSRASYKTISNFHRGGCARALSSRSVLVEFIAQLARGRARCRRKILA